MLIVDDPIKNQADANSATYRHQLHEWYESVAYPRLQGAGAVIIVSTRWHQDDLCGWLLREHRIEGWDVVSLPALAEPGDALLRQEGEALWPRHFGPKKLARIREAIGGAAWASLYQQRPAAAEGQLFRREWWKTFTAATRPPHFEQIVLSLDTAYKAGSSNDFSVGLVLGVASNGYFILDVWRGRVEFPQLKRQVGMLALRHPRIDRVLVEDKASGQSLIQELRDGRLPITPVKVGTDKVTRATAVTPLVESGRVFLPESAPWLADFLDEISAFPTAPHDDMVDALTQALNYTRESNDSMFAWGREEAIKAAVARAGHNFAAVSRQTGLPIAELERICMPEDDLSDELADDQWRMARMMNGELYCATCFGEMGPAKARGTDGRWRHPYCEQKGRVQDNKGADKWRILG